MKTPKTYRLSPTAIEMLEQLKEWNPEMTETGIIEAAIIYQHFRIAKLRGDQEERD